MSDVDIYESSENLISSDEYSEEDDDDLMNNVVCAQSPTKSAASSKAPESKEDIKKKKLKLLLKRKKLALTYKKRSLKWLKNNNWREKYKDSLKPKTAKEVLASVSEIVLPVKPLLPKIETVNNKIYQEKVKADILTIDVDSDEEAEEEAALPSVSVSVPQQISIQHKSLNIITQNIPVSTAKDLSFINNVSELQIKPALTTDNAAAPYDNPNKTIEHQTTLKETIKETPAKEASCSDSVSSFLKSIEQQTTSNENKESPAKEVLNRDTIDSFIKRLDTLHNQFENNEKIIKNNNNSSFQEKKSCENITMKDDQNDLQPKVNKRARSPSPQPAEFNKNQFRKIEENKSANRNAQRNEPDENVSRSVEQEQKQTKPPAGDFYKNMQQLFVERNEVIGNKVKSSDENVNKVEDRIERIQSEIATINILLAEKEFEWNKLLYMRGVKEEIIARLNRKKDLLNMRDEPFQERHMHLLELKDLDKFLSEPSKPQIPLTPAQQLIENRANMKPEDLEKDRRSLDLLYRQLVSNNIITKNDDSNYPQNVEKNFSEMPNFLASTPRQQTEPLSQLIDAGSRASGMGRQGPLKAVTSIIADFQENHPDITALSGKRMRYNESARSNSNKPYLHNSAQIPEKFTIAPTNHVGNINHTPTLEKLLSAQHLRRSVPQTQNVAFQRQGRSSMYDVESSNDRLSSEVTITPVNNDARFYFKEPTYKVEQRRPQMHMNLVDNAMKPSLYRNHEKINICQECKMVEALFVCAGCQNQWYCSRKCQVNAWDEHSDLCTG